MLKLAKVYLWLLWVVPTLVFLGVPSSFSLVIFYIPIVFAALKVNIVATILPVWAIVFFVLLTALSSFFGDVPLANVLISYSLILQFAFGFALGGVDWRAHLGGLIGGVVAAQLVMKQPRYY